MLRKTNRIKLNASSGYDYDTKSTQEERTFIMKKFIIFMVCMAFLFTPAYAKSKKKSKKESTFKSEMKSSNKTGEMLSSDEKEIIKRYYQKQKGDKDKKKKKLPPGMQKKVARGGKLPPGWEKKVGRGEVLDREVFEHSKPLPEELKKELPKQPEDTVLIKAEDKIIKVIKATREILDVFDINF
jgi:hypothetical protein